MIKRSFFTYILLVIMAIFGCDKDPGTDSLHRLYPQTTSCTAKCHNAQSEISPDPTLTNGAGSSGKHIAHVTYAAIACEMCHAAYAAEATHLNGARDTGPAVNVVSFDSSVPGAWNKTPGPPVAGVCDNAACHGSDSLDWYGTSVANYQECTKCHAYPTSARRPIVGTGGDFGGNNARVSHHISGTSDPLNDQCLVCHDQSNHTQGTVMVKNADSGAGIAYTTPASLETFCLSCHDPLGATATFIAGGSPLNPFSDGSTLGAQPYPYASGIADSWAKSIGHGTNGNHMTADKLTCLGTGAPGTGCHGSNGAINAHGSQNQVLAARAFTYDINYMQFGTLYTYNEAHFDLCFNCHNNYAGPEISKEDILGVKFGGLLDDPLNPQNVNGYGTNAFGPRGYKPPYDRPAGSTSHFLDHHETGSPLNDVSAFFGTTPDRNLHWFHLGYLAASFRGPGTCSPLLYTNCSGITCVNCHDVHGSNTAEGAVYDEMGYHHYTDVAVPGAVLGQMSPGAYDPDLVPSLLGNHPTYCAFNCHPMQDITKAWLAPITE